MPIYSPHSLGKGPSQPLLDLRCMLLCVYAVLCCVASMAAMASSGSVYVEAAKLAACPLLSLRILFTSFKLPQAGGSCLINGQSQTWKISYKYWPFKIHFW